MFPDKVADVRRALRVGDLVSFIAVDEPDVSRQISWNGDACMSGASKSGGPGTYGLIIVITSMLAC